MGRKLWEPGQKQIRSTNLFRFMGFLNSRFETQITDYPGLHSWSVENISEFWAAFWEFAQIKASRTYDKVVDDKRKMPGAEWFPGARLNFAENLLRYRDQQLAMIFRGEDNVRSTMTYAQLYRAVARLSKALSDAGVKPGDRVAGFMPNMPQTIIAMLASASIGAMWTSCSPDFGIKGVLDRFGQIQPKVLFTADGYFFKGRPFDSLDKIAGIIGQLPSVETVVVVPYINPMPDARSITGAVLYDAFVSTSSDDEISFEAFSFSHPLYIMYSSGTTGLPKCMVQSAGGVLINHLKELMLHTDLKRTDTIFYFTTCGWMMWNWLASALAVGATLVLYDGNPFHPTPGILWELAQAEKISVFGISAGYISALKNTGIKPGSLYDLSAMRTILSTGSVLSEEGFEYIYTDVKQDVQLASISGGSDINGCFALGNPIGPVYCGELQCRGLGMDVRAFDANGRPVIDRQGELVCIQPSPSMPLYF